MYTKIFLPLLLFYFIAQSLLSQEIKKGGVYNYARKIVDTMASESMHGRGYVNGGDSIAANYIKTEFKKSGLKSFTSDYYQRFSFPVNTFPGEIYFKTIEKQLYEESGKEAGENYLINCASPGIKGNFKVTLIDSSVVYSEKLYNKFKKQKFQNKFIIVDSTNVKDKEKLKIFNYVISNPFHASGIIVCKSLRWLPLIGNNFKIGVWDVSQTVNTYPVIEMIKWDHPSLKEVLSVDVTIENKFIPDHHAQNVVGYVEGSEHPDSFIVYTAHYDHLGQMGDKVYFPGANDNASGCAMLLNLAKYYSMPEHKPKYSIAFMAFCGEEAGLLGSKYYTEHPLFPMKNIRFLLNMDIMGTGEDGITVVNGTLFKTEFDKLKEINSQNNYIKDVKIRGKAANSDHYFFAENGVKACFIYTMGGIKAYHDIYDRAETLPLNEFENLFKLITKFGDYLQN